MAASPVPMSLVDGDGGFVEVNAAFCEYLGYDAETLRLLTWQQLTHPGDLAVDLDHLQEVVTGSSDGYTVVKRYVRSDGNIVVGELRLSAVRGTNGDVQLLVAQIVDITQRQRDLEQREESEERYRLLAENTSDVVTLQSATGEILWASPSWAVVLQFDPDAVVGTRLSLIHDDDRPELQRRLDAATEAGLARIRTRNRVLRADGEVLWMDTEINFVYAADGSLSYTRTAMRNVSEQVAAQRELAASEERYRLLADYSADVVFTITTDFEVSWASPAVKTTLGWTPDEFARIGLRDLVHPDDRAAQRRSVRRLVATGASGRLEVRLRRKDGSYVWVESYSKLIPPTKDRPAAHVVRLRDISSQIAAREELAASEERYRLLAEHSMDVVMRVDAHHLIEWVSPSAQAAMGVAPEELVGQRTADLLHPDDVERFRTTTAAWRATGGSGRITARFRVGSGGYRWFEEVSSPITEPDGTPGGRAVRLRDIEAEVQATQSLTSSEEMFRRAMADSGAGMALIAADGSYLEVNDALCVLFGYDRDTLRTMRWQTLTHPDDLVQDDQHAVAMRRGEIPSYRTVKRYVRADGSTVVGDVTITAIRDSDDTFLHFVAQVVDVTEQHRMTRDLAKSEEHFRLLAENTTDIVVRADLSGNLEWISQSVTPGLGYLSDDLVGVQIDDLVHTDDVPPMRQAKGELVSREPARFEARIRDAGGQYRWHSVMVSPLLDEAGHPVSAVASARNIEPEVAARKLAARREAEFRMLAENASDVVIRTNGEGRIEWVSPSVADVLGYQPDDLLGRHPTRFLPKNEARNFADLAAALDATGPNRRTVRLRLADGSFRWFSALATILEGDSDSGLRYVIGLRDIDAEVQAVAAVRASEERFRAAMASAPGGMAVLGLDRRFVEVNDALAELLGRRRRWLLAHRLEDVLHPDDVEDDMALRRKVGHGQVDSGTQECRLLRADGTVVWVQHAIALMRSSDGSSSAFISQFVDITSAKQAREDLEFLARHDPLTRLANRRVLVDTMARILSLRPRAGMRPAVLFVDLDGLKPVNDEHGHTAGDELIVQVANRIRSAVRTEDLVARIGGDEFVVLLPAVRGIDDVVAVGDKIRQSIGQPFELSAVTAHVTASAGATVATPGEGPEEVLRRADGALYEAKEAGRNRTFSG